MPRDSRLYMTFPNDFWTHHKVAPRSDAAFRAFVEMNGYSRMHDLDGRVPAEYAEFKWAVPVLAELVASHPTKPLVLRDGDDYVIRDYAEHQQTKAEREARVIRNTENGRKGGRPRKNPNETDSVTEWNRTETEPKAEIETELEIEVPIHSSAPETVPKTPRGMRGSRIPEPFLLTTAMREWAAKEVPGIDVAAATRQFVDYWRAESGSKASKSDWVAAWRFWLRRDGKPPANRAAAATSKADRNAAEFHRLYGGQQYERTRGVPAIDSGVG